jgi:hypothetical protein
MKDKYISKYMYNTNYFFLENVPSLVRSTRNRICHDLEKDLVSQEDNVITNQRY